MKKMLGLVFAIVLVTGCADKRPESLPQGTPTYHSISDYDGKEFTLTTGKTLASANSSSGESLTIAEESGVQRFDLVSYTTLASLLGDVPFVGKPNTTYTIRYEVTDTHLDVLKVANKDDIPYDEHTIARKLPDGRLAVPLVGYPISSLFTLERARNEDDEETRRLMEVTKQTKAAATHFRFDPNGRSIYEAVEKRDVFNANFFDGEWFYSETIVGANAGNEASIGMVGKYEVAFTHSDRIRFEKTESQVRGLNVNIDERVGTEDDVNLDIMITIPVEWKQYEIKKGSTQESENNKLKWNNRNHIKIDFKEAVSNFKEGNVLRLVDVEVAQDYFSFTIQRLIINKFDEAGRPLSPERWQRENVRVRYSFLKATDRQYQPKRFYLTDSKKFGFFPTEKSSFDTYEKYREEDYEKLVYVSRFNPKSKEIVYRFTRSTPQWLRPVARQAVTAWNEAFKAAGTNITVRLEEAADGSKDVNLGDLRYNTINIVEAVTGTGLLGFGPSVTDPYSGEIISATANVHITPIRENIVEVIRGYVRSELGLLQPGYVLGRPLPSFKVFETPNANGATEISLVGDLNTSSLEGRSLLLPDTTAPNGFVYKKVAKSKKLSKNFGREMDFTVSTKNIISDIQRECPEVTQYVKNLKDSQLAYTSDESLVVTSCSSKLLPGKMIGTLIHEMGHNFGLMHNFYGSVDVPNFWPKEVTQTAEVVRSSSIMEYTSFNEDRLTLPGRYDIAAIRFAYADAIELQDGSIKKIDPALSIQENLSANEKLRAYKYCNNWDAMLSKDPMCQMHDAGTTPAEVMRNLVAEFNASFALYNYRYDKANYPINSERVAMYRAARFYGPAIRFYEEWRSILSRYVGLENQYLENFSQQQYEKILEGMKNDPTYGPLMAAYKPAADLTYRLLKLVVFLPNKYCLATDQENNLDLIELEDVRNKVYHATGRSVSSCADKEAAQYISSKGLTVRAETGYFLNDLRFDMDIENVDKPLDVAGTLVDRFVALGALTRRSIQSVNNNMIGFAPGILDEPTYRNDLLNSFMSRTIEGLNLDDLRTDGMPSVKLPKFNAEKDLVGSFLLAYAQGVQIPNKPFATQQALAPFTLIRTDNNQMLAQAAAVANIGGITIMVPSQNNFASKAIVDRYNELNQVINTRALNSDVFTELKAVIEASTLKNSSEGELAMTVDELNNFIQSIVQQLQALPPQRAQVVGPAWQMFFATELEIMEQFGQMIEALTAQGKTEEAEKLKATLVKDLYSQFNIPVDLYKDKIMGRADAIVADSQGKAAYVAKNRVDLEAQRDLLLSLIQRFAR